MLAECDCSWGLSQTWHVSLGLGLLLPWPHGEAEVGRLGASAVQGFALIKVLALVPRPSALPPSVLFRSSGPSSAARGGSSPSSPRKVLCSPVPGLVCPHPAAQHWLHVAGRGCPGMQTGSFRPLNVMGESSSSKAMSLSMVRLSKFLCITMLVTPFTSRDGLCKSLVPSTTLRSAALVAQTAERGRKVTKHPEFAVPPKPTSHLGAFTTRSTGAVAKKM